MMNTKKIHCIARKCPKKYQNVICVFIIFAVGFCVAGKSIDKSGLWYDEAIEYWFSRVLSGPAPGQRLVDSMYLRIRGTFQPPLYNILMYFWLLFFDSETGFRYASVVLIVLATVGIYSSIKVFSNSCFCGLLSGLFYLSLFSTAFYAQECAEYALVMCSISWTVYFWIALMKAFSRKRLVTFVLFSCISIYSQYGAVFPVAGMGVVLCGHQIILKKWNEFKETLIYAVSALVVLIGPLLFFFLIPQAKGASGNLDHTLRIEGGLIKDIALSLYQVISFLYGVWITPSHYFMLAVQILIVFSLMVFVAVFAYKIYASSRKNYENGIESIADMNLYIYAVVMLFISYGLFYLAVKTKYYGISYQTGFNNRYSLVMGPLIILLVVMGIGFLYQQFEKKKLALKLVFAVLLIIGLYCIILNIGTTYQRVKNNWVKCGVREATVLWLSENDYQYPTIVNVMIDPVFEFYRTHSSNRSEDVKSNIITVESAYEQELNRDFVSSMLGEQWPERFFYLGTTVDINAIGKEFEKAGYTASIKYEAAGISMLVFDKMRNDIDH